MLWIAKEATSGHEEMNHEACMGIKQAHEASSYFEDSKVSLEDFEVVLRTSKPFHVFV